jgi:hypothetical protein
VLDLNALYNSFGYDFRWLDDMISCVHVGVGRAQEDTLERECVGMIYSSLKT